MPVLSCLVQFCDVIKSYPLQPQPEIFGLHVNADITCQQAETYELLATVLGLQPRTTSSSSAADSQEAVVARVAKGLLSQLALGPTAPFKTAQPKPTCSELGAQRAELYTQVTSRIGPIAGAVCLLEGECLGGETA